MDKPSRSLSPQTKDISIPWIPNESSSRAKPEIKTSESLRTCSSSTVIVTLRWRYTKTEELSNKLKSCSEYVSEIVCSPTLRYEESGVYTKLNSPSVTKD